MHSTEDPHGSRVARAALVCLGLLGLLGGCDGADAPPDAAASAAERPAPAAAAADPIDVFATRVEQVELTTPIEATGTIAPLKTTDILPLVGGLVEKVFVTVGDRVEAGAPLFAMRTVDLELSREELSHALALAEAEAANARADLKRSEGLSARQAVSEDSVAHLKTAVATADARVGIARARLAQVQQSLKDAVVRAPYRGVITARNVDEGAFIETRGMSMQPAMQIMEVDIVGAIVRVPETEVARIAIGTPATVRIDGLDARQESRVHIINDLIDPDSRTFEVRVGLANDDYAIRPGLFCRVTFHPPGRSARVLDRTAVRGDAADGRFVWLDVDGRARRAPVEVHELDTARVEVVSGVDVGDRVLAGAALDRLVDGAPVRVVPDPS